MKNKFTQEDKKKLVEFMNYVAENATFKHKTDGVIKYFRLLAHIQQVVLPKVEASTFEIKRVVESKKKTKKTKGNP